MDSPICRLICIVIYSIQSQFKRGKHFEWERENRFQMLVRDIHSEHVSNPVMTGKVQHDKCEKRESKIFRIWDKFKVLDVRISKTLWSFIWKIMFFLLQLQFSMPRVTDYLPIIMYNIPVQYYATLMLTNMWLSMQI